jgi:hypothetical protein
MKAFNFFKTERLQSMIKFLLKELMNNGKESNTKST